MLKSRQAQTLDSQAGADAPSCPTPNRSRTAKRTHRAWSLYIGSVAGIPIYLHVTFLLLLAVIAFAPKEKGEALFGGLALVIAVFASVALHELGHALMARLFGIKTDDIVLYPIGGVARLRSMGENLQEFWIALAGPAVNVAIASTIAIYLYFSGRWSTALNVEVVDSLTARTLPEFLERLMVINVVLVLFNMVPAFPMDGGRVLRSLLTMVVSKERATSIAASIGQALAIVFVLVGLVAGQVFLMIIGIFVFMAAGQESLATRSQALLSGKTVRDAMITRFEVLNHGDTLGRAADLLLATSQEDFPVMNGGDVLGVLRAQGTCCRGWRRSAATITSPRQWTREFQRARPSDPLESVLEGMRSGNGPILVVEGDRLVGYVNNENLMEYLMIQQVRK